jgi:hypothetical protein
MNHRTTQNTKNFLTSWATTSYSRRPFLHWVTSESLDGVASLKTHQSSHRPPVPPLLWNESQQEILTFAFPLTLHAISPGQTSTRPPLKHSSLFFPESSNFLLFCLLCDSVDPNCWSCPRVYRSGRLFPLPPPSDDSRSAIFFTASSAKHLSLLRCPRQTAYHISTAAPFHWGYLPDGHQFGSSRTSCGGP